MAENTKDVTRREAIKLAVEALRRQMQSFAFDNLGSFHDPGSCYASIAEEYGEDSPTAQRALKMRRRIGGAIKVLQELKNEL